ncbi:hypothetical protein BGX31_004639 [Mortierella sp. GBA43]|nr:hypothetical protein BGX31_004639 [Mortierella sp. GBA43]
MYLSHRDRLSQIGQETGLDFIRSLNDPDYISPANATGYDPDDPVATTIATGPNGFDPHGISLGLAGIDPILEQHGPLQPGDMIDFHGPSCSGKTLYLYAITISTILPKSWKYSKSKPAVPLSGKARSVIFMDMDQGFSASQLKTLLCLEIVSRIKGLSEKKVSREDRADADPNLDPEVGESDPQHDIDPGSSDTQAKIEQLAMSCLQNVHVFRPPDAISTIVMLRTMDQYLLNISSNPTSGTSTTDVGTF